MKAIAVKTGFTSSAVTSGVYTLTAAAPTFSPVAGTYTSAQTVTITSTTSGASIHYTTDGTTPSATAGTLYAGPVAIGATTTLKAIAFKTGFTSSAVTSSVYTINLPTAAAPVFSPVAGTFTNAQTVTITSTTSGASINYTTDGTTPSATAGTLYAGPVAIGATTTLKAIAFKTGFTSSAVTSGTYTLTAAAPTFSPVAGTYTSAQTVTITSATSGASIHYTTDGTTPSATAGTLYVGPVAIGATTTLKAIAFKTGFTSSAVTSGVYTINLPTAAAPTFSPVAGTYTSIQTVTITSATSGASIHYTTDGTTPSATAGTLYAGPIAIGVTTTLKAIAFKTGFNASAVTSGVYAINLPTAAAPTFSPVAGTYTSIQTVTITSTTSGASIHYTTDGTTPSATAGALYAGPVAIGATTTLKAIAFKTGFNASAVTSGVYTINLPTVAAPTFSPVAGTYTSIQTVTITSATSGTSINYTMDGSTPSATVGTPYSGPVAIGVTTILKAVAFKTGFNSSTVTSGAYTILLPPTITLQPQFSLLHSFNNSDGDTPVASLMQGADGRLYGTTLNGGATGQGTVFAVNQDGTGFVTLYSFTGGNDGRNPYAGLIQGTDGRLYGTAHQGGATANGTVFAINSDGTGFTALHSFVFSTDGANPAASLMQGTDGRLYGVAGSGGINGSGTVFGLNPDGTGFTTLYKFTNGNDGGTPYASLIQGTDGRLYGTTPDNGFNNNFGAVFAINPDGTGFTTVYRFTNGNDGASPYGGVIQGVDGRLYGTTSGSGGANSRGTVFVVNPDGTGFATLYSFTNGNDGSLPYP